MKAGYYYSEKYDDLLIMYPDGSHETSDFYGDSVSWFWCDCKGGFASWCQYLGPL